LKSDEARKKLFGLIDEFVPNETHNAILKGMAISYAYDSRLEGFDKASGLPKDEVQKTYTALAVVMKAGKK
jgi:hypothetical protein